MRQCGIYLYRDLTGLCGHYGIIATVAPQACGCKAPETSRGGDRDTNRSLPDTHEKGYPERANPGPYRALSPRFRSFFAQKTCSFTHFFRKLNIRGILGKTERFARRCKTLMYAFARQKSREDGVPEGREEKRGHSGIFDQASGYFKQT